MGEPPDPRTPSSSPKPLYSEIGRVKKSERLKRNVLEISIEREENAEDLTDSMLSKLLIELGIKKPDVEGIQLVPERKPKRIFVWMQPNIDLSTFCRGECFTLDKGCTTGQIKPMDRKETEVLVKGLNINTPDGSVIQYLSLFGKVMKHEVV